jgi:NAD-dependent deacetylase
MRKLVVLSGAGMSAESGIPTFRGSDGLWEGHRVEEVASPLGWRNNPALVLEFYNQRRRTALASQPNLGHQILAQLEQNYDVTIITQNVDNLHERAGSSDVVHLHGVLSQSRSTKDPSLIYEIDGWELKLGDLCERGAQLRPNIVWFGESVTMIQKAAEICSTSDIFVVVGTSLLVYPAAGLIHYVPEHAAKYIIDPLIPESADLENFHPIQDVASRGISRLYDQLRG